MQAPLLFRFRAKRMIPWGYVCVKDEFLREGNARDSISLVVERWGKTRWPSIATTSNSFLITPEVVTDQLMEISGGALKSCPVDMAILNRVKPVGYDLPKLFALMPLGRIPLLEDFLGAGYVHGTDALARPRAVPDLKCGRLPTFALPDNVGASWYICTMDVVLLARKNRWSDFGFTPLDYLSDSWGGAYYINHMGKQWPPKWYPDDFKPHPNNLTDVIPVDPLLK